MKKCPFCKAEIEDNARFCLYCMKPLNAKENISAPPKKKPWWLLMVIVVVLVMILTVSLLFLGKQPQQSAEIGETNGLADLQTVDPQSSETVAEDTQDIQSPIDDVTEENSSEDSQPETDTDPESVQNQDTVVPKPSESTQISVIPEQPETPTQKPTSPVDTKEPTENVEQEATEEVTQQVTQGTEPQTTENTTVPAPQPAAAVYVYRAAQAGDDFSAHYQNSGSDIVITGVEQPSADGIYDIPAYIDGKKVIAIVANAFYGSNAKVVYVPATVKTIWNYAFNGCNLTDIYFRGNAIYTENKAFSGSLTIHCAASCSDRNLRYYKDSAVYYDATWEEWNG